MTNYTDMQAGLGAQGITFSDVLQDNGWLVIIVPEMDPGLAEQGHTGYVYNAAGAYQYLHAFGMYARGAKVEP